MQNLIGQTVSLIDNINNKSVGITKILKAANDVWVLDNRENQLNALLHKDSGYKLSVESMADTDFIATPLKLTKDFIVVKVIKRTGGRERRRYIRVSCDLKTIVTYNNETSEGLIYELAYGSVILISKLHLMKDDNIVIRITEMDGETVLNCSVMAMKYDPSADENDPWFKGFVYILIIDSQATGEKAMDMLYSKIYRLQGKEEP